MKNKFSQAIVLSMVTLSSMAFLTACSSHKESSSADKTPKSSVVRPASLVLKSRSLLVQILNLQVHQVVKSLLHQVQAVVRLSHHLQIVHQFPQAVSHRLLNLQTRVSLQPVNPKRQRAQVIVKLQVVNLAAKLKLKRICK